ncbi:MAG: excinuclease ABC subunit B [Limisphaerales bacterium]|nr:MAG: excinuclease ABC subunit B [Limisphaerales bacterium]KAG0510537.1 MAG: excinuclease ABC subunit B [Limisphaerales bacterium]TXT52810.1 MAG: excinuclease ABC subunit B [Limisphaerales bacterium]
MFELIAPYSPAGDQPQAIEKLTAGVQAGAKHQVLLGVTGSGKTYTIANVIQQIQRPTLVISHNKTLAAQLYAEFKSFFPKNAVEYFVSYFDYYQPEAYIPRSDTFIEKDSSRNDEIERLRLSTMSSLFARRDVIVVASVSCIYGIGSKEDYEAMVIPLRVGMAFTREQLLSRLVDIQYTRNDIAFERAQFRVRGDTLELRPGYTEDGLRIEFFGDEIDRITRFEPLTGEVLEQLQAVVIYPGKQFVTTNEKLKAALLTIREELGDRIAWFEKHGKLLEAQRIKMRTEYDLEMMEEMGVCSGIENYSRHIAQRPPGSRPTTLIDFMPDDFLLVMDESHVSVPQIGGMYAGDRSRKEVLVEHGFRLPSALDNRPLSWLEFQSLQQQTIYVSATPAPRELEWAKASARAARRAGDLQSPSGAVESTATIPSANATDDGYKPPARDADGVVELVVRPTGLIDPTITLKPLKGQIDDLIEECRKRVEKKERVLVTTLTKRTAEELTDYLRDIGINVRYLHSEVDALERVEIIRGLRKGQFDVLVGINLLREGLDLPEVSLVAILDADKEGFLRSETSLIQTAGRAARHLNGEVILYADVKTQSIQRFLAVCEYRRKKQVAYNTAHGITPRSVTRVMEESLSSQKEVHDVATGVLNEAAGDFDVTETILELEGQMIEASNNLEFEKAALYRDQINELKRMAGGEAPTRPTTYGKKPAKSRKTGKPTWTPRV